MKNTIKKALAATGFEVRRLSRKPESQTPSSQKKYPDFDDFTRGVIQKVNPYTRTSPERISEMVQAVRYVVKNHIPGDIVECGVWMGGSMLVAIETLMALGDTSRSLYLYDTFEGMTDPGEDDITFDGRIASEMLNAQEKDDHYSIWCKGPLESVSALLLGTDYPESQIHFVRGRVEETIPQTLPQHVALLRLDTDWYESTRHELQHLYPVLVPQGVMIVDDYGYWQGARKAVDEYFGKLSFAPFLGRIDYTGRICVKPAAAVDST